MLFLSWWGVLHCLPSRTDHGLSEYYLHSPLQLEHAFQLLLDSELFAFHSERMCELAIEDVQSVCEMVFVLALHISRTVENESTWSIYLVLSSVVLGPTSSFLPS